MRGIYKDAPQGVLRLYIDLKIDAKEMSSWESWRIDGFFRGIARMVGAIRDAQSAGSPADLQAAISEVQSLHEAVKAATSKSPDPETIVNLGKMP